MLFARGTARRGTLAVDSIYLRSMTSIRVSICVWARISAQVYNEIGDVERLAEAVLKIIRR